MDTIINFDPNLKSKTRKVFINNIQAIKELKKIYDHKGKFKYCYNFGGYVILRNRYQISNTSPLFTVYKSIFNYRKERIDELVLNYRVNTPQILGGYFDTDNYEIQECAPGNILAIDYPCTAKQLTYENKLKVSVDKDWNKQYKEQVVDVVNVKGKHKLSEAQIKKDEERVTYEATLYPFETETVANYVYIYDIAMQNQLKNAPQCHFDKFVKDLSAFFDMGIELDYQHSENFLYHKDSGFWFIDIDDVNYKDYIKHASDYQIAKYAFTVFRSYEKYTMYMSDIQRKTLRENKKCILKKLMISFKKNNFNFSEDELAKLNKLIESGCTVSDLINIEDCNQLTF